MEQRKFHIKYSILIVLLFPLLSSVSFAAEAETISGKVVKVSGTDVGIKIEGSHNLDRISPGDKVKLLYVLKSRDKEMEVGTWRITGVRDGLAWAKVLETSHKPRKGLKALLFSGEVKGRLFVETVPKKARVRILNIQPVFSQGMELDPGKYHVEVSAEGYETEKRWVNLSTGKDETISMRLTGVKQAIPRPSVGGGTEKLVQRLSPAVVHIKTFGTGRAGGAGSGVIISTDGLILGNDHVVAKADKITVTLADQKVYQVELLGRDPKTDLAVLKIEAPGPFPAAVMGDSDGLQVGERVLAMGNPFGRNHTVVFGTVQARKRDLGVDARDDIIQTDAAINPGDSGGPLFNMQGEVVGISTTVIGQGHGTGFSLRINTAMAIVSQLLPKGEIIRGYLGVGIENLKSEQANALNGGNREGALVIAVTPDSPADECGLKRGDIITAFNGKAVKDTMDLTYMVADTPVDTTVTVTIKRDGKVRRLRAAVGRLNSAK